MQAVSRITTNLSKGKDAISAWAKQTNKKGIFCPTVLYLEVPGIGHTYLYKYLYLYLSGVSLYRKLSGHNKAQHTNT